MYVCESDIINDSLVVSVTRGNIYFQKQAASSTCRSGHETIIEHRTHLTAGASD